MKKFKTIFTTGSYDLLHCGHVNIFHKAKALGDYLIVGVSTDELIKSYKGVNPIIKFDDRASLIKELRCVDEVVMQRTLVDIDQFIGLKADIFVLGDDWKDNYSNTGINWLRNHDKIVWVPYTEHLSTSKIKASIIKHADSLSYNLKLRKKND